MNIYDRLKKDHRRQEELARKLAETEGDSPDRRRLFAELREEVEAHADAEEQTFYAELMARPEGQEKARHSVKEHAEVSDLLDELADTDFSSSGWLVKLRQLKDELEHHVEEEEDEVFVLARRLFDDETATKMTSAFERRKRAERQTNAA